MKAIITEDFEKKYDRILIASFKNMHGVELFYHYIPAYRVNKVLKAEQDFITRHADSFKWYKEFRTYQTVSRQTDLANFINQNLWRIKHN